MSTTVNVQHPRPSQSSETIDQIVALLVRFPEISSIRVRPPDGTVTVSYAIGRRVSAPQIREASAAIEDHVRAYLDLSGEEAARLTVDSDVDRRISFLHVVRDVASFSREELTLIGTLLEDRFAAALLKNPPPDDSGEDDLLVRDELAEHAIEAMRDPSRLKNLVGFREEARVVVYFLKNGKSAKARGRS